MAGLVFGSPCFKKKLDRGGDEMRGGFGGHLSWQAHDLVNSDDFWKARNESPFNCCLVALSPRFRIYKYLNRLKGMKMM